MPEWWLARLREWLAIAKDARKMTQTHVATSLPFQDRSCTGRCSGHAKLAAAHLTHLDYTPDQAAISRCVNGKTTTVELVLALCKVTNLPRPVFFADTEEDARWMETRLGLEHEPAPDEGPEHPNPHIKPKAKSAESGRSKAEHAPRKRQKRTA